MGIVKDNISLMGLSGKFGDFVFRSYQGRTVFSKTAAKPTTQSEQQKANREKFKRASSFAKTMMQDPEMKKYYQRRAKKLKLPNAYTAAVKAYMRDPTIAVL